MYIFEVQTICPKTNTSKTTKKNPKNSCVCLFLQSVLILVLSLPSTTHHQVTITAPVAYPFPQHLTRSPQPIRFAVLAAPHWQRQQRQRRHDEQRCLMMEIVMKPKKRLNGRTEWSAAHFGKGKVVWWLFATLRYHSESLLS